MDIRELLRHLRATASDRAVQRDTNIDRRTVQRYRAWAAAQELLSGPLPALEDLQRLVEQVLLDEVETSFRFPLRPGTAGQAGPRLEAVVRGERQEAKVIDRLSALPA